MNNGKDSSAELTEDANVENLQEHFGQAKVGENQTLRDSIEAALDNYFTHLDGQNGQ